MSASNSVTGLMLTVALARTVSCSMVNWVWSLNRMMPPEKTAACWSSEDLTLDAATSMTSESTMVVTVVTKKLKNSPVSDMTVLSSERKASRLR